MKREIIKGETLDLTDELFFDTYLAVKFASGKFVHYNIPIISKKLNRPKTFGDLYNHFVNRDGFRFAIGYIRQEDESTKFWAAFQQYFYFSKKTMPEMCTGILETPLLLMK